MTHPKTPICKCGTICNKENTSSYYLKRKTPVCKECIRKKNAKNRINKGIYAKTEEQKIAKTKAQAKDVLKMSKDQKIKAFFEISPDVEFNARYINYNRIDLNLQPTGIQSVMGTGKTTYVEYFMRKAQNQNKKVLYICPNITTADSTYHTLKSKLPVAHYKTVKDQPFRPQIVISTVDSCDQWLDYDVLIVDEVLSLFSETTLKTHETTRTEFAVWNSKYKKIMQHGCPIILDRYISLVLPLFDQKMFIVRNNYKKSKQIQDYSQTSRNEFLEIVIDTAKKRTVAFHTNWISSIEKLEEKATEAQIEIKSIHSKSPTKIKELQSAQLMCSTSKLSRGIDLEAEEVFLQDTGNTHSVITALQMIDRARESKVISIRVTDKDTIKTKRVYESYKPLDEYEQRLHLFDVSMSYLDKHFKKVLFFMLQDTYNQASPMGLDHVTQTKLNNAIGERIGSSGYDVMFNNEWVNNIIGKIPVTKEQIKRSIELYVLLNKDYLIHRL